MESDSSDDDNQLVISTFAAASSVLRNIESSLQLFIESEEDDNNDQQKQRLPNKKRDFDTAYNNIKLQYFNGVSSIYSEGDFETRFRIPRSIFVRIYHVLRGKCCFVRKYNPITQTWGIQPLVRVVSCFKKLVYGDSDDRVDDSLQLSRSSVFYSFKEFCRLIVENFGPQYLNRCPNDSEKERCLEKMKCRGFPGCFASWDCKHFQWNNCPVHQAGQHLGMYVCFFSNLFLCIETNIFR